MIESWTARWHISAGEITEWLSPLRFIFAVLASAWVLHDARRRFPLYAVAAWTLATLISAPLVLPLYLIARTFRPRTPAVEAHPQSKVSEENEIGGLQQADAAGLEEKDAAGIDAAREDSPDATGEQVAARPMPQIRASFRLARYAPSLLYAFALLSAGAFYFYRDYRSFDAHLARAVNARLLNRRDDAIREYRAALRLAGDAHTHKLLAVQLAEDGQTEAALAELRAAERGGDPDETLTLRIASALDALGRAEEAVVEYEKFLRAELCLRRSPPPQCAEAAARVRQIQGSGVVAR